MMGEMRKSLCQNTNIVTARKKQTNKQTNKKQNKGPAKKVSNFQEAAFPFETKKGNVLACTPRPSELNDSAAWMSLKS